METRPSLKNMAIVYQLCMHRIQEERPTVSEILALPCIIEQARKYKIHIGFRKPVRNPSFRNQEMIKTPARNENPNNR